MRAYRGAPAVAAPTAICAYGVQDRTIDEWPSGAVHPHTAQLVAVSDYADPYCPIMNVLDGKDNSVWSILPQIDRRHYAVFEPDQPLAPPPGGFLRFTLRFKRPDESSALGRFRLSVSGDPDLFDREQKRLAAMKLTDPWQKLAAAYRLKGDQQAIDRLVERRPNVAGAIGDLFAQGPTRDWQRGGGLQPRHQGRHRRPRTAVKERLSRV